MTDRGTYIKMSDSLPEHRKIVMAGGDAAWLHVCALAYASRNLTDGFFPQDVLPRLSDRKAPAKLAARLIDVNLWHGPGHECKRCPQPQPGEYVIHDYLEHQRSAARVAEVSDRRAAAGRKGGSKSKPKPKQFASALLESGLPSVEASAEPSFAEEVLRTSQTEEPLRGSQAEMIPPPADTRAAEPNPQPIVAAYVDGAKAAGQPVPSASLKARVGRQARELLREHTPSDVLVRAADHMGRVGWNDLAVQVQRDAAAANGNSPAGGHQTYRNPTDQSAYDTEELRPS